MNSKDKPEMNDQNNNDSFNSDRKNNIHDDLEDILQSLNNRRQMPDESQDEASENDYTTSLSNDEKLLENDFKRYEVNTNSKIDTDNTYSTDNFRNDPDDTIIYSPVADIPSEQQNAETSGDDGEYPPVSELDNEKRAIYEALLKNMDDREKDENEPGTGKDEITNDDSDEDFTEDLDEDLNDQPIRRRRKRKSTVGHLIFSLVLTAFIVSAAFLCAGLMINIVREMLGIGKADDEIVLEIPETDSLSRVADIFIDDGIIADKDLFLFFARVRGVKTIVPGAHEFSANMTYGEIADELQSAATEEEREAIDIMFPEGTTLAGAGEILELADICSATEFVRIFNSSEFGFDFEKRIRASTLRFYKMEGYCFPDTYRFYLDEDVKFIVKKIYRNFEAKLTPDLVSRMNDMGLTQDELITFASVVQAEAARNADMKMVASVFWNRLNNPEEFPLLQSDPTGNYVEDVIMPNIEVESEEMYAAYNTYEGGGLPPGPINNPGLNAINAVLYPEDTTYYYFCSNLETGEFFFAETLREHEENLVLAGLA
jgi:UPF0755 protein